MIRVMIVDDHQIFVDGVKALIQTMNDIKVVGEANNGVELIDALSKAACDVVLLDVNMPKMNGLETIQALKKKGSTVKFLMLTMNDQPTFIQKIVKAGAHGYVLKNTQKLELEKAINSVYEGENYFSEAVTKKIMDAMQAQSKALHQSGNVRLTEREIEVLKLIVQENTSNEIAEKLFISTHTVESHRKNMIAKLGVRGTGGLIKYAIETGIAD